MSLTYDLNKCENRVTIFNQYDYLIQPMVFSTVALGIPQIQNEKDAVKFRCRYLETGIAQGANLDDLQQEAPLEMVRLFIGLRTNAPTISDNAWKKQLARQVQERAYEIVEKEKASIREAEFRTVSK